MAKYRVGDYISPVEDFSFEERIFYRDRSYKILKVEERGNDYCLTLETVGCTTPSWRVVCGSERFLTLLHDDSKKDSKKDRFEMILEGL